MNGIGLKIKEPVLYCRLIRTYYVKIVVQGNGDNRTCYQ